MPVEKQYSNNLLIFRQVCHSLTAGDGS